MASVRSLTAAARLISTALRRHHHTAHPFNISSDTVVKNPFGVADDGNGGPRRISECKLVNNRLMVLRYDMPGLSSKSLKVRFTEDNFMRMEGEIDPPLQFGCLGEIYTKVLQCDPELWEMKDWKAEVKNGVLWVTLPITKETQWVLNKFMPVS